jgi:hypothetical protein
MPSFIVLLLVAAFVAAFIWLLHRNQQRRTVETVDRTAPLPALDEDQLPDFAPSTAPAHGNDNWLAQIKTLREAGQLTVALTLSRENFPRTQAFQQAAIILRQQIRNSLEHFQPADALLAELFHTAALADLFRTSSSHKPHDPQAALAAVRDLTFSYGNIGYLRLKLLNKSDIRALEQLWGSPATHRHVEEVLGELWLQLCRPGPAQA